MPTVTYNNADGSRTVVQQDPQGKEMYRQQTQAPLLNREIAAQRLVRQGVNPDDAARMEEQQTTPAPKPKPAYATLPSGQTVPVSAGVAEKLRQGQAEEQAQQIFLSNNPSFSKTPLTEKQYAEKYPRQYEEERRGMAVSASDVTIAEDADAAIAAQIQAKHDFSYPVPRERFEYTEKLLEPVKEPPIPPEIPVWKNEGLSGYAGAVYNESAKQYKAFKDYFLKGLDAVDERSRLRSQNPSNNTMADKTNPVRIDTYDSKYNQSGIENNVLAEKYNPNPITQEDLRQAKGLKGSSFDMNEYMRSKLNKLRELGSKPAIKPMNEKNNPFSIKSDFYKSVKAGGESINEKLVDISNSFSFNQPIGNKTYSQIEKINGTDYNVTYTEPTYNNDIITQIKRGAIGAGVAIPSFYITAATDPKAAAKGAMTYGLEIPRNLVNPATRYETITQLSVVPLSKVLWNNMPVKASVVKVEMPAVAYAAKPEAVKTMPGAGKIGKPLTIEAPGIVGKVSGVSKGKGWGADAIGKIKGGAPDKSVIGQKNPVFSYNPVQAGVPDIVKQAGNSKIKIELPDGTKLKVGKKGELVPDTAAPALTYAAPKGDALALQYMAQKFGAFKAPAEPMAVYKGIALDYPTLKQSYGKTRFEWHSKPLIGITKNKVVLGMPKAEDLDLSGFDLKNSRYPVSTIGEAEILGRYDVLRKYFPETTKHDVTMLRRSLFDVRNWEKHGAGIKPFKIGNYPRKNKTANKQEIEGILSFKNKLHEMDYGSMTSNAMLEKRYKTVSGDFDQQLKEKAKKLKELKNIEVKKENPKTKYEYIGDGKHDVYERAEMLVKSGKVKTELRPEYILKEKKHMPFDKKLLKGLGNIFKRVEKKATGIKGDYVKFKEAPFARLMRTKATLTEPTEMGKSYIEKLAENINKGKKPGEEKVSADTETKLQIKKRGVKDKLLEAHEYGEEAPEKIMGIQYARKGVKIEGRPAMSLPESTLRYRGSTSSIGIVNGRVRAYPETKRMKDIVKAINHMGSEIYTLKNTRSLNPLKGMRIHELQLNRQRYIRRYLPQGMGLKQFKKTALSDSPMQTPSFLASRSGGNPMPRLVKMPYSVFRERHEMKREHFSPAASKSLPRAFRSFSISMPRSPSRSLSPSLSSRSSRSSSRSFGSYGGSSSGSRSPSSPYPSFSSGRSSPISSRSSRSSSSSRSSRSSSSSSSSSSKSRRSSPYYFSSSKSPFSHSIPRFKMPKFNLGRWKSKTLYSLRPDLISAQFSIFERGSASKPAATRKNIEEFKRYLDTRQPFFATREQRRR